MHKNSVEKFLFKIFKDFLIFSNTHFFLFLPGMVTSSFDKVINSSIPILFRRFSPSP